jgi:hypothetical protein
VPISIRLAERWLHERANPFNGGTVTRPAIIPAGSWPRRMSAALAAGYCGEPSVEAFIARVGHEYPEPRVNQGRRQLWLRDDLDQAILPNDLRRDRDVAEDL